MWSGANSRTGLEVKEFITKGSRIVTAKTGAQFTTSYFELLEKNTKFDSEIFQSKRANSMYLSRASLKYTAMTH